MTNQPAEVQVSSLDGKVLFASRVMQSNGVIDIPASGFKPGTYIVKLKQGDFNKTFKVIKQ